MSHLLGKANQHELALRNAVSMSMQYDGAESELIDLLLNRYFAQLRYGLKEIQNNLKEHELLFIANATQSAYLLAEREQMENLPKRMGSRIEAALYHDQVFAEACGVDGKDLLAKLSSLSFSGSLALIDVVERWYANGPNGPSIVHILEFDLLAQMRGNAQV